MATLSTQFIREVQEFKREVFAEIDLRVRLAQQSNTRVKPIRFAKTVGDPDNSDAYPDPPPTGSTLENTFFIKLGEYSYDDESGDGQEAASFTDYTDSSGDPLIHTARCMNGYYYYEGEVAAVFQHHDRFFLKKVEATRIECTAVDASTTLEYFTVDTIKGIDGPTDAVRGYNTGELEVYNAHEWSVTIGNLCKAEWSVERWRWELYQVTC